MAVYVDLEKALLLAKSLEPDFGFLSKPLIDAVQEIIRQASPEDVAPVIHAKWIKVMGMNEQCSNCRAYFPLSTFHNRFNKKIFNINYCPNCGAKMDKED